MKISMVAATIVGGSFLSACAPIPVAYNSTPAAQSQIHTYNISVVDAKGSPIRDATVVAELTGNSTPNRTLNCSTDENGKCPSIEYRVYRDATYSYVVSYSSKAKISVTKDGYYKQTSSASSNAGSAVGNYSNSDAKITLLKPTDFINQNLDSGKSSQEVKSSVLKFLDAIRLQSLLVDTSVMLGGIGNSEFKGKNYLQVKLDSSNVYNSLKLSKYDLGKTLFDDSVRKILNPLNESIILPKNYYGYDVIINGKIKSFADQYASAKSVEYRFLMPAQMVRKYKDKEISGQALLDSSIQLMDDERIELKLQ